jgi:hypothetical protein
VGQKELIIHTEEQKREKPGRGISGQASWMKYQKLEEKFDYFF